MRRLMVAAVLVLTPACITKAEYSSAVRSWRSYYDATKDDLKQQYDILPEPLRTTRLNLVRDEEATIHACEVRAESVGASTTAGG